MAFSMKLPAASAGKNKKKQYGLILPTSGANKPTTSDASTAFNVFGGDSGRDKAPPATADAKDGEAAVRAAERRRVGEEAKRSLQQSQIARTHAAALAEDPSVFDYDGVYDAMQSSRRDQTAQRRAAREAEKKHSKYISTLVEKAKIREIEHERIRERRLLKERAAEDALYGDKDKLISASYKRKLMEMKRWDEEDARLEAQEAREEVTKRGTDALAGFYSNLLTKNIAMGGAAGHSTSAYTAGKAEDRRGDDHVDREHTSAGAKADEDDKPAAEGPAAKKPRPASPLPKSQEPQRPPTTDSSLHTPAVAPAPSQPSTDEVIAAAKARYLARKAQRSQSGGTGGTTTS